MIRKTAEAILLAVTLVAALTQATFMRASTKCDGAWSVTI